MAIKLKSSKSHLRLDREQKIFCGWAFNYKVSDSRRTKKKSEFSSTFNGFFSTPSRSIPFNAMTSLNCHTKRVFFFSGSKKANNWGNDNGDEKKVFLSTAFDGCFAIHSRQQHKMTKRTFLALVGNFSRSFGSLFFLQIPALRETRFKQLWNYEAEKADLANNAMVDNCVMEEVVKLLLSNSILFRFCPSRLHFLCCNDCFIRFWLISGFVAVVDLNWWRTQLLFHVVEWASYAVGQQWSVSPSMFDKPEKHATLMDRLSWFFPGHSKPGSIF